MNGKRIICVLLAALLLAGSCACGKTSEKDVEEMLDQAEESFLQGDYEEAVLLLESVLEVEPANVRGYLRLSDAYIARGETDKALALLQRGYELTQDKEIQDRILGMTEVVDGITDIAAGDRYALLLSDEGEVFYCGDMVKKVNNYRFDDFSTVPEQVEGLANIRDIGVGYRGVITGGAGYAITQDQELYVWGDLTSWTSAASYLTSRSLNEPTKIMSGVASAVATDMNLFIVKNNGDLYAYGSNEDGQLGDGGEYIEEYYDNANCGENREPTSSVISGVYKIEVGLVYYYEQDSYSRGYVVLALTQSHELYGWGMLGLTEKDGKIVKVCYNTPVKLAEEVADMGVTKEELYLVTTDGALQCIAVADAFQDEKTFTDVTCGTVPVESVCCGDDFFVARDILGLLYCGGSNREGQLGVEDPEKTEEGQTVMPLGETRVRMAAAGAGTAYVLLPDGTMLAWGDNDYGQIGNGRRGKQHSYDEPVYLTAGVNMVFAGTRNSYYTLENGDLYAMGSGYSATPVKVFENVECVEPRDGWLLTEDHVLYSKSDGEYEPYMEGVADYESSGECHLVLKEDGSLWGWGDNESGELGIGTRSDPLSSEAEPVTEPVLIMEGVAKAAVSYYPVSEDSGNTVLILLENGDLYLCGYDLESDSYWDETTGDPSESFLLTPQKIREGVRDIYPSDGTLQSFYITDDNQLFAIGSTWDLYYDTGAWDENDEVALRDGVKMTTDDFLLDLDGTVNIFGSSTMIELFGFDEESWTEKAEAYGIGRLVCEPVLEGMKTIASSPNPSYDHYLAVTETGDLYVWGDNTYGQLGLGDAGTDENIFTVSLPS